MPKILVNPYCLEKKLRLGIDKREREGLRALNIIINSLLEIRVHSMTGPWM